MSYNIKIIGREAELVCSFFCSSIFCLESFGLFHHAAATSTKKTHLDFVAEQPPKWIRQHSKKSKDCKSQNSLDPYAINYLCDSLEQE